MFNRKLHLLWIIFFIVIASFVCSKDIVKADDNKIVCNPIIDTPWGFSATAPYKREAPGEDIYIFEQKEEWEKFINKHLKGSELPDIDFEKDKILVIHTKLPQPTKGPKYEIQNIEVNGRDVNVFIKQKGGYIIDPDQKNLWFSHIIICKIDAKSIPDNSYPSLRMVK